MRKGNATEFYRSLKLLQQMSPEEIKEVPRALARGAPLFDNFCSDFYRLNSSQKLKRASSSVAISAKANPAGILKTYQ
jgi:hypothetical protein